MKKILCFAIAFFLSFGCLTGCGDTSNGDYVDDGNEDTEVTTTTTSAITTTAPTETTTTTTTTEMTTTTLTTTPVTLGELIDFNNANFQYIGHNSASGLQYVFFAKYIGEKQLKYFTCYYKMYNSVDDSAYDSISGKSMFSVKTAGPVNKNQYISDIQKNTPKIYSEVCSKLNLYRIEFEFMDGTLYTYDFDWPVQEITANYREVNDTWIDVYTYFKDYYQDYYEYIKSLSN
ncbi:MAG: hypothetical protein IJM75_03155 [Ruminococcus sp.]|nr:hypothetical protein [Ruminococcus sp.]